jgi:hypothetical protein
LIYTDLQSQKVSTVLLLEGGMLLFYVDLTSAFVIPLLTLFLMGTCTRAHRRSGLIGLLVGTSYGVLRLFAPLVAEHFGVALMPAFMVDSYAAYPLSMIITAGTMVLVSFVYGWETQKEPTTDEHVEKGAWLRESQEAVRQIAAQEGPEKGRLPLLLAVGVVLLGCVLSFVVFW